MKLKITKRYEKINYGASLIFLVFGIILICMGFKEATNYGIILIIFGIVFLIKSYCLFKNVGKEHIQTIKCEKYEVIGE